MNDILFMMTNASCISISWLKFLAEVGVSKNQVSNSRECQSDAGKLNLLPSPLSIGVLHEIARRCDTKVQMCFDLTRDALPPTPLSLCCSSHSVLLCRLISDLLWVPVRICNFLLRSAKPCFLIESNFVSLVLSESSNDIILCFFFFFFGLKDIILCSLLLYLSFLASPLFFL